jgi:CO/xanthine dehydrogenase FAD-binding subunit
LPIEGSDFTDTFDIVIKAIGEGPDTSLLSAGISYTVSRTASPVQLGGKLFAGGDFVTGPSTVIQAVAAGKEGANLINNSFGVIQPTPCEDGKIGHFTHSSFLEKPRARDIELPVSQRTRSIDIEDISSLPQEDIETEAKRCFNCGCLAVTPSDIASALIALDARIITTKKVIPAEDFFKATATHSIALETDELIKEIRIPKPQAGAVQRYEKFTLREPVDFALISVASTLVIKNNICNDARIVLGAVAPVPIRAKAAEQFLKGKQIDEETADETARLAIEGAKPLSGNAYKVTIAKTLVKKAILS